MNPAFKKNKHISYVLLFIILALLAPFYIPLIVDKEAVYKSIPINRGDFYHQANEIYNKKEPIDVLFLGVSDLWQDISPIVAEEELSKIYNRKFNVVMFANNWAGHDVLYLQLKDLLEKRKVKLVIITSMYLGSISKPHVVSKYLWEPLDYLTGPEKLSANLFLKFYAEKLLVTPRILMTIFQRKDRLIQRPDMVRRKILENKGGLIVPIGYRHPGEEKRPFVDLSKLKPPVFDAKEIIDFGDNQHFKENAIPLTELESVFLRRIINLTKKNNAKLAMVSPPHLGEPYDHVATRSLKGFSNDAPPIIGLSLEKLFSGFTKEEYKDFYDDRSHMNSNGAAYLTRAIMPAIRNLYEQKIS